MSVATPGSYSNESRRICLSYVFTSNGLCLGFFFFNSLVSAIHCIAHYIIYSVTQHLVPCHMIIS